MPVDGKLISFQSKLRAVTHYLPGPSIFKRQKQNIFKIAPALWRDENSSADN
jgi:hypothetical protein